MISGAPNFTLKEFRDVSARPLTMNEVQRAEHHARVLQSVRNAVNTNHPRTDGRAWIVRVTSYLRTGSGSNHGDGAAVDWVVADPITRVRSDRLTKWARDWLGSSGRERQFSRLLWEWDHVHHVLAGMDSFRSDTTPLVLDQTGTDETGRPLFTAALIPGVDNALSLSVVLLAGAVGYFLLRS